MWKIVILVLPALIPSWRFFKSIEPSPRLQWAWVDVHGNPISDWRAVCPRPERVSPWQMIGRLFWNPVWNESLFMVSCAERIQQEESRHSIHEVQQRVRALTFEEHRSGEKSLCFRLFTVRREGTDLVEEITFVSAPFDPEQPSPP